MTRRGVGVCPTPPLSKRGGETGHIHLKRVKCAIAWSLDGMPISSFVCINGQLDDKNVSVEYAAFVQLKSSVNRGWLIPIEHRAHWGR